MIVKISKIDNDGVFGVKDARGNIKAKYDNCFDKWVPGLHMVTGILRTGLADAKEERKFEEVIGLDTGSLARNGSYWENFSIIIPSDGLTIDTVDPTSELKYKVLSADPTVASTEEEASQNSRTEYLMVSETIKAKGKNTTRDTIANAFSTFVKLSQSEIIDALYMFGKDPDVTDAEVCRDMLGDIVEKKPAYFLEVVGDKMFKDKIWIIKLTKLGLIKKQGKGVGFNMPMYFGDVHLGNGLEEVITTIKLTENQNLLSGLKAAQKEALKVK